MMLQVENGQHKYKQRKKDQLKDEKIQLIKTEFSTGLINFDEFFEKICIQVYQPYTGFNFSEDQDEDPIVSPMSSIDETLLPDIEDALFGPQIEPQSITEQEQGSDDESSFHYIDSLRNNEALEEMREGHRQRRQNIDQNLQQRVSAITEEDIRTEVFSMWRLCGKKRVRVRESDKKEARSNLIKRYRFEETDKEDQLFYAENMLV